MEKKDLPRFRLAMKKTRLSLPGQTLDERDKALQVDIFWEKLKPYKIEDVEMAFDQVSSEVLFFPAPKEVLDRVKKISHERVEQDEQRAMLEWRNADPHGREKAVEVLKSLSEKWEAEDEEQNRKRAIQFEERRIELKKQAKLIAERG